MRFIFECVHVSPQIPLRRRRHRLRRRRKGSRSRSGRHYGFDAFFALAVLRGARCYPTCMLGACCYPVDSTIALRRSAVACLTLTFLHDFVSDLFCFLLLFRFFSSFAGIFWELAPLLSILLHLLAIFLAIIISLLLNDAKPKYAECEICPLGAVHPSNLIEFNCQ